MKIIEYKTNIAPVIIAAYLKISEEGNAFIRLSIYFKLSLSMLVVATRSVEKIISPL